MSIRDELKAKLQENIAKFHETSDEPVRTEQQLMSDANSLITEFLIPKFRQIALQRPLAYYLTITLYYQNGSCEYSSNIDTRIGTCCDMEVVLKAMGIAEKYDIKAFESPTGADETTICFVLDLSY